MLCFAKCFATCAAELADAARRRQPGVAQRVANFDALDIRAHGNDDDALVSGNQVFLGFDGPVALYCVQVGVADPGGLNSYEYLPEPGTGTSTSLTTTGFPSSSETTAFISCGMVLVVDSLLWLAPRYACHRRPRNQNGVIAAREHP